MANDEVQFKELRRRARRTVMATQPQKVRENSVRRMAKRQGLELRKSRRRDPRALDYGVFWLVDDEVNAVVAGGRYGISLDEAEAWLTDEGVANAT